MGNLINNNGSDSSTNTSVAISSRNLQYGTAIGAGRSAEWIGEESRSVRDSLQFYFGEYISGIFFIFAVFCFTFLVPAAFAKPGKVISNMVDRLLKKTLDISGAVLGLILASPLFIVIPVLIKLDSPGSIFYTQDRVGLNRRKRNRRAYRADVLNSQRDGDRRKRDLYGKPFKVIKFRTMVSDAEVKSGPIWATKNDARITRLGRFLRKTRIDEVPQLINVLLGDMSMVGPRPERPFFVHDLSEKVPGYKTRLRVKPGITGLAQVNNGYDSSVESVMVKVRHDITYIRTWTIFSDLRILMKTVLVVITGKGAC
ncbi:hypothetical protein TRIP_C30096 [Candidatus Zixiibacteriota bacterium]|nr:hypothetical protein TRIP_C30096 [candidate division Zixibacteria bacterium]